ncbi:MAG: multiubiquitin domain-containing protein [Thermoleophilia bacterium]
MSIEPASQEEETEEGRPGKPFRVMIDAEEYEVTAHELTGREILALAELTPETHRLIELTGRNQEEIPPEQVVHISSGLRFVTVSTEPTPVA